MLQNVSELNGYAIAASDGSIGTVSDCLFDDESWSLRWLVVDTGNWLSGRKVLLPPSVLGHPDPTQRHFAVRLTKKEIEDSPGISTDRPVSRQMETSIYDHYGWNPYWGASPFMGPYAYYGSVLADTPPTGTRRRERELADAQREADDPHLRSINEIIGYHIQATDGDVGHVEDVIIEDVDWSIHYLVVDTKNWWPGKKVLISPRSAEEINWEHKRVKLNVERQKVKDAPAYDASKPIDRLYERSFHGHYAANKSDGPAIGRRSSGTGDPIQRTH